MLMGQGTKQFSFPEEPRDLFLPTQMDDFDGDLAMQLCIRGQVHFCHSSPSQQACEVVAAQGCSFQGWHRWLLPPPRIPLPYIDTIVEDKGTSRQQDRSRWGIKVQQALFTVAR